jgi:hypothetical protein
MLDPKSLPRPDDTGSTPPKKTPSPGAQQMEFVTKRSSANRRNAKKSTGPRNTTSTRFNATKHGLLAAGITELDDAEGFRTLSRDLKGEKEPVGVVEGFLVEFIALSIIRRRRLARLEAEYITGVLNPPIRAGEPTFDLGEINSGTVVDPGLQAPMSGEAVQLLFTLYQRYATGMEQQLYRGLHELERLQRMRRGERLPAPAALDVTVHTEPREAEPVEPPEKVSVEGSLSKLPEKPDDPSS